MMNPLQITILGGGTAGWMCANLMAKRWQARDINITVIESSAIGTVGVGEGSTPFLRLFFNKLGLTESEWMPACDATYKCGIDFPGWCGTHGPASYFHPFYAEVDAPVVPAYFSACDSRRQGHAAPTLPDDYFVTSYLYQQQRGPMTDNGSVAPSALNGIDYGYHFDSAKLGAFLKQHAIKQGVVHIDDRVESVSQHANGDIHSLQCTKSGEVFADWFVDCSGFKGLLIQQTLDESLIDYRQYLPNNAAVAMPVKHQLSTLPSATVSKALSHGWMWKIPLQQRLGTGYVFNSDCISAEAAELQLREQTQDQESQAKLLTWTPGRVSQHWKNNCVAIGLSQGFLEPLEAPMLNIMQHTCEAFIDYLEASEFSNRYQSQFNTLINNLFDGTRDYLQAHYLLNTREDTNYWVDARNNTNVSPAVKDILAGWKQNKNMNDVLRQHADQLAYMKTSWYCLLAGMGCFAATSKPADALVEQRFVNAKRFCQTLAATCTDHRSLLTRMGAAA